MVRVQDWGLRGYVGFGGLRFRAQDWGGWVSGSGLGV